MKTKQLEIESKYNDIPNYCKDCELLRLNISIITQKVTSYCPYNCIEKLGNNARELNPDEDVSRDPMDLATDKFLNEYMRGEH